MLLLFFTLYYSEVLRTAAMVQTVPTALMAPTVPRATMAPTASLVKTASTPRVSVAAADAMFRAQESSIFSLHWHWHWHQHQVHHQFHQSHLHKVTVFDVPSDGKCVYKQFDYKPGKHILTVHEKWIKPCVPHVT